MTKPPRIESIDLLRGAVMILMALDHSRDYFHIQAFTDNPLNLETTTPVLYFTRWFTHFCAPIFVFLAGTSAYLQSLRKSKSELSWFLIKRGCWLILMEIFVVQLLVTFDESYEFIALQTIWAIGVSMVILGVAIRMPYYAVLSLGLIIVLGHNLLDTLEANHQGEFGIWWDLLHHGNMQGVHLFGNHYALILYPFLPWTGLMMLGYAVGKLFAPDFTAERRRKWLLAMGSGALLLFVLLRWINVYGDPYPWTAQRNGFYTFLSFIDVHKYPPSLFYMCITIGVGMILLALIENFRNKLTSVIIVYGRVPFLYYLLHFFLLHLICAVLYISRGHSFEEGFNSAPGLGFNFFVPGEGYRLGVAYAIWIVVVVALYPVCKWFSEYKAKNKSWWLSYL